MSARIVVTRRHGESVQLGRARVTVHMPRERGRVRLVIEAPAELVVLRTELIRQPRPRPAGT